MKSARYVSASGCENEYSVAFSDLDMFGFQRTKHSVKEEHELTESCGSNFLQERR